MPGRRKGCSFEPPAPAADDATSRTVDKRANVRAAGRAQQACPPCSKGACWALAEIGTIPNLDGSPD